MPEPSVVCNTDVLYDAVEEFIATTSIFRQRRESRDAFEKLALAVLTIRMGRAGQALGEALDADS
jgi:hypothetical protein